MPLLKIREAFLCVYMKKTGQRFLYFVIDNLKQINLSQHMNKNTCLECGGNGFHFTNCPEEGEDTPSRQERMACARLAKLEDSFGETEDCDE